MPTPETNLRLPIDSELASFEHYNLSLSKKPPTQRHHPEYRERYAVGVAAPKARFSLVTRGARNVRDLPSTAGVLSFG